MNGFRITVEGRWKGEGKKENRRVKSEAIIRKKIPGFGRRENSNSMVLLKPEHSEATPQIISKPGKRVSVMRILHLLDLLVDLLCNKLYKKSTANHKSAANSNRALFKPDCVFFGKNVETLT